MTIRWKTGKPPTLKDVEHVVSNSLSNFKLESNEIKTIATNVLKFMQDRIEGKT